MGSESEMEVEVADTSKQLRFTLPQMVSPSNSGSELMDASDADEMMHMTQKEEFLSFVEENDTSPTKFSTTCRDIHDMDITRTLPQSLQHSDEGIPLVEEVDASLKQSKAVEEENGSELSDIVCLDSSGDEAVDLEAQEDQENQENQENQEHQEDQEEQESESDDVKDEVELDFEPEDQEREDIVQDDLVTELTAVEEVEDITEIVTEDEVDDDEEEEDDDEDTQQASVSLKQRFTVSSSEEENSSSCDSFKRKRTTTPAPITQYSKVESDFSVSEAEEVVDSTALVESFSEYSSS